MRGCGCRPTLTDAIPVYQSASEARVSDARPVGLRECPFLASSFLASFWSFQ
jgi:hypothetical protein